MDLNILERNNAVPKSGSDEKAGFIYTFLFTSEVGFAHETAYHVSKISLKAE